MIQPCRREPRSARFTRRACREQAAFGISRASHQPRKTDLTKLESSRARLGRCHTKGNGTVESVGGAVPESASSIEANSGVELVDGGKSLAMVVGETFARMPEWIRHDLGSKDLLSPARAEETLCAIVIAALSDKAETGAIAA